MEKVWKGALFTLHVTVGGVFYVMQQHAPVHTRLLLDRNRMQEHPVYIKTEAEVIWKQSALESIFRDWKRCFEANRQLEHGRSVLFPPENIAEMVQQIYNTVAFLLFKWLIIQMAAAW